MDSKATICLKSELDLFEGQAVQLAIEDSAFLEVKPVASLSENAPIEFYISANGEEYLDFGHSILHLQMKITKKNDTALLNTDIVAPINYILNTIFSELSIYLNDKQITSQSNYSYRALIESLLLSSKSSQETMLTSSLFFKDTAVHHNDVTENSTNIGFVSRRNKFKNSKLVDLLGPLHFDLGAQPKLLIPGVNIRLKLERAKNAFALMASADNFKISINSASLFVRKIKVAPSIILAQEKALDQGLIRLPIRRVEVKSFTISAGIQSISIANSWIGAKPQRIIFCFVSNEAYNGSCSKNPFCFQNFGLNYLCLIDGGRMIPSKPFQPDFESNLYARCYLGLFTDLNRFHNNQNININYDEYKSGYTFYAIDLTPDMAAGELHVSVIKNGNIGIDSRFATPLTETVSLIAYAEFRNVIEIDKQRNVYTDY